MLGVDGAMDSSVEEEDGDAVDDHGDDVEEDNSRIVAVRKWLDNNISSNSSIRQSYHLEREFFQ